MAKSNSRASTGNGSAPDSTSGSDTIDPKLIDELRDEAETAPDDSPGGAGAGSGPVKRRRRRRNTAEAPASLSVEGIEGVLLTIHVMLASMTQTPELVLSEPEAKAYAVAVANVARHYPSFPITAELQDWLALGLVIVRVYSTRAIAIGIRKRRKPTQTTTDGNLIKPTGLWPAAQAAPLDDGVKH
jgi:hypothetical protein